MGGVKVKPNYFLGKENRKQWNQTYKLPLQLALATGRLALDHSHRAVVRAHVQVVIRRDALAEVGSSRPEVGKRRLGARAGLGAPAALGLIFTLHVILQTPQLTWRRRKREEQKAQMVKRRRKKKKVEDI